MGVSLTEKDVPNQEKSFFSVLGQGFPTMRHLFPEDTLLLQSNNIFHS